MNQRERKLLFIIYYEGLVINRLQEEVRLIIADTNKFIEQLEVKANQELETLLQKQLTHDQTILDTWAENTELIWHENQAIKDEIAELKRKKKPKGRYYESGETR